MSVIFLDKHRVCCARCLMHQVVERNESPWERQGTVYKIVHFCVHSTLARATFNLLFTWREYPAFYHRVHSPTQPNSPSEGETSGADDMKETFVTPLQEREKDPGLNQWFCWPFKKWFTLLNVWPTFSPRAKLRRCSKRHQMSRQEACVFRAAFQPVQHTLPEPQCVDKPVE